MSSYTYERSFISNEWDTNISLLAREIKADLPNRTFKVVANGSVIVVSFEDDLTESEISTLNSRVLTHQSVNQILEKAKLKKLKSIDFRTSELFDEGFEFPPQSKVFFSLSSNSQNTLLGLNAAREAIQYPINYNSKDDKGKQVIPNSESAHSFFLTAVATVKAFLDSGTALKDQVREATNIFELNAITDDR